MPPIFRMRPRCPTFRRSVAWHPRTTHPWQLRHRFKVACPTLDNVEYCQARDTPDTTSARQQQRDRTDKKALSIRISTEDNMKLEAIENILLNAAASSASM